MIGKLARFAAVLMTATAVTLGAGIFASPVMAEPKTEGAQEEEMEFDLYDSCQDDGGKAGVTRVEGSENLVTTCTYPDGSMWGCTDNGYCDFKEDHWSDGDGKDVSVFSAVNDPDFVNFGSKAELLAMPDAGNSFVPKSIPELIQDCIALHMGEPTLVIEAFGGVYVVCEVEDGEGGYGWACGDLKGDGGYDCRIWHGDDEEPYKLNITSGFSISVNGTAKAATYQVGGHKGVVIDNSSVVAREVPLPPTDKKPAFDSGFNLAGTQTAAPFAAKQPCDADDSQDGSSSGPGGDGLVVDPATPPADPTPAAPFFTSGINLGNSQVAAQATQNETCAGEDDAEETPPAEEPVDDETVAEPTNEGGKEEPAPANEPANNAPTQDPTANDRPVQQPAADADVDQAKDSANKTAPAVEPAANTQESSPSEASSAGAGTQSGGLALGLLLLGAVALATPAAAGALLLYRRRS